MSRVIPLKPGDQCQCNGECAKTKLPSGMKGHRYPGECLNKHLERTQFDIPRVTAVLSEQSPPGEPPALVCQWCAPAFQTNTPVLDPIRQTARA